MDDPLVQVSVVRQECAALRAQLAADTARLEGVATSALETCAAQREELDRLRAEAPRVSIGGAPLEGTFGTVGTVDGSAAEVEAVKELERVELALVQERQKSARLLEEKITSEESHSRDVKMLEGMLSQVIAENERLSSRIADLEAAASPPSGKAVEALETTPVLPTKEAVVDQSPVSSEVEEPEMEPRRISVETES